VCSQTASDLALDDLPDGVALLDFGERHLDGLARPERVWQVAHPDLPTADTPPAAPTRPIDPMLTSFVGREAELAELLVLLRETRLLTVTGLGGSGKTRLALELATRTGVEFRDGVCTVELAGVHDGTQLAPEILAAAGLHAGAASDSDLVERLCQGLARRQLLLLLDNCEHLIGPVSAVVESVLGRCPGVTVLATSREALSLPGEVAWPAPGLSLPPPGAATIVDLAASDAACLFAARARLARPGFQLTDDNARPVARVCRRLDGLPLALELAAARVRVLGVAQLAEHLDDRFRLLSTAIRSTPSRHQTMRAVLDWSFELLTEPEQRLLARLSVFPQDFDLDAAAAVAGEDADVVEVLDRLARLIGKSMLVSEGWSDRCRYRLLETVRQYAAERLAAEGRQIETAILHRRHYVARVEAAQRSRQGFNTTAWALAVAADRGNFHAALVGALADDDIRAASILVAGIWTTWFWFGPIPAIPDAMASVDAQIINRFEPAFRVQALLGLAGAGWITGHFSADALHGIYKLAMATADASGNERDQGFACYFLGYLARGRGDLPAARSWTNQALARWEAGGATLDQAWAHYELGWIDVAEDHIRRAQEHFRDGFAVLELAGDELLDIHLQAGLALTEAVEGNAGEAAALARAAVVAARRLGFPSVLVMALVRAAETAAIAGTPAGPDLAEALRVLREQGTRWWVAAALNVAALASEAEGHRHLAVRLLGGATELSAAANGDDKALPVVAVLTAGARDRLTGAIGADDFAREEAIGRRSPPVRLLDAAVDALSRQA
jgi:predicted ATPase